jgi:hypothetical protein
MPRPVQWLTAAVVIALLAESLQAAVLTLASEQETAYLAAHGGGRLWFVTGSGLYQADGPHLARVATPARPTTLAEVEGEVWLGTVAGLFRLGGGGFEPLLAEPLQGRPITSLAAAGRRVAVGTPGGLFVGRLGAEPSAVEGTFVIRGQRINAVAASGGDFWVGTDRNAYRVPAAGGPRTLLDEEPHWIGQVLSAAGHRWLILGPERERKGYCFSVEGDRAVRVDVVPEHAINAAAEVEGEIWFATTAGVYRFAGGHPPAILVEGRGGTSEPFNAVFSQGGEVWLASTQRAYRREEGFFQPIPETGSDLRLGGIATDAGRIWMWSEKGVLLLREDLALWADPKTHRILGTELTFGRGLELREAGYRWRDGAGEGAGWLAPAAKVEVAAATTREDIDQALTRGEFLPWKRFSAELSLGPNDVYLAARDELGNVERLPRREVWRVPTLQALAIVVSATYVIVALACLFLAPHWAFARDRLPFFLRRRLFGLIDPLLFFGPIRRHQLRRHLRWARGAAGFKEPSGAAGWRPPEALVQQALAGDPVIVSGIPARCAAFLRHLGWCVASGQESAGEARRLAPVLLDLRALSGRLDKVEILEGRIADRLRAYGGINDPLLVQRLLDRGSFVILLEGLEALAGGDLSLVEQFTERYRHGNRQVLSWAKDAAGELHFSDEFRRLDLSAPERPTGGDGS